MRHEQICTSRSVREAVNRTTVSNRWSETLTKLVRSIIVSPSANVKI